MSCLKHTEKKNNRFISDSYRVIDANLNRAKEAFRVCEDVCRFHLNDAVFSSSLNKMRHRLTYIVRDSKIEYRKLFEHRDTKKDTGKNFFFGPERKSFKSIFFANCQRAKEALRVLEEFLKIFDTTASKKIQKLRFDFYGFEKKVTKHFPALFDTR